MATQQEGNSTTPATTATSEGPPRMYSEDELNQRFRGAGKAQKQAEAERDAALAELARREAADSERARREAEERGQYKTIAEQERAEKQKLAAQLAEINGQLAQFAEREAARLAAVTESNAARVKALPDKLRDLIPQELAGDALAAWLPKIEAMSREAPTFGGSPRPGGPGSAPDSLEALSEKIRSKIHGTKK